MRKSGIDYRAFLDFFDAHGGDLPLPLICNIEVLDEWAAREIEAAELRIEQFEERIALQLESRDAELGLTGKSTTDRAIDALQRPERFRGEHDVAKAWLRDCAPAAGIFKRVAA